MTTEVKGILLVESPFLYNVVWILCKPVILFCCTKETVVEGIIFRGVPLACLAGVQRER